MANQPLIAFKESLQNELASILGYWQQHTVDHANGGFYGRIDHLNTVDTTYPKGIILNTRILWTFARANNFYQDDRYTKECDRAFDYLWTHFRDATHGGVFWEVDFLGKPTNKRKQLYAQAFCIYALSEYYKYAKKGEALQWAMELYQHIEEKAYDEALGGYYEAFGQQWEPIEDVRLSEKDENSPKTTNTHLHILEAYTTLYEVTQNAAIKKSLERLLQLFQDKLFDGDGHLQLFFSRDWTVQSTEISFGHDIEAVWLLIHAARTSGTQEYCTSFEQLGISVADTFLEKALDSDFGVLKAQDRMTQKVDTDRHWWPQIEAMVGLTYIWKITGEATYLDHAIKIWDFTQNHIIDHAKGEWFFRVDAHGQPYTEENKVGPWKCPYHNGRGLMEILEIL